MPRPLKVFKTHIGFYDLIVASPSRKAAAETWGAKPTIFSEGFAAITSDADTVQAALAHPGVVLKRPHGQKGSFKAVPDAVTVPEPTVPQKRAARDAEAERRRQAAAEKRAQRVAKRKARKEARDELAEIEREEAQLRERRQRLRKKFHLRDVK